MNPYNPMLDYQKNQLLAQQQMIQNQLNQLNQQRQSFQPYPVQNQSEQFFIKQVGSIDEAKSYPVDPSIIYLFPDTGTGKIYLKRLNTDNGKSELFIYSPEVVSKDDLQTKEVSKDDLLTSRLDSIEKKIGEVYESISGFKVHAESAGSHAAANAPENAETEPAEVPAGKSNAGRKER